MSWKWFFRGPEQSPGEYLFNTGLCLCAFILFFFFGVRETRKLLVAEEALQAHRGQVVDIFVETRLKRGIKIPAKKKRYTLVIEHSMANGLDRYRIGHDHRSRFAALQDQLKIRDTVIIYVSEVNFDGNNPKTIRRIDKDGQTVFSYAESQRQTRHLVIAIAVFLPIFFALFLWNLSLYRKAKRRAALEGNPPVES